MGTEGRTVKVSMAPAGTAKAQEKVFQNIIAVEVSNSDRSLTLKRKHNNGTNYVVFQAQPNAWLSYEIVEE